MTESERIRRARAMRYKKAALSSLTIDAILGELYEIQDACADVHWYVDSDDDSLLNALNGDEDAEYEFKTLFADLEANADRLHDAIHQNYVNSMWLPHLRDYFDDCIVSLIGNRYELIGYDVIEEDYYALTSYESELAVTESGKRLMRHTKAEIISMIGHCLGILLAFLDLRQQYDYLKAALAVLRDENTSYLKVIKEIDEAYENAAKAHFLEYEKETQRFDRLLSNLPDRAWIE